MKEAVSKPESKAKIFKDIKVFFVKEQNIKYMCIKQNQFIRENKSYVAIIYRCLTGKQK